MNRCVEEQTLVRAGVREELTRGRAGAGEQMCGGTGAQRSKRRIPKKL